MVLGTLCVVPWDFCLAWLAEEVQKVKVEGDIVTEIQVTCVDLAI
jgi:hypothetical protein